MHAIVGVRVRANIWAHIVVRKIVWGYILIHDNFVIEVVPDEGYNNLLNFKHLETFCVVNCKGYVNK